ncbi:hypothetical protein [Pareuzebyella sediminis]|uniref:hypothetical protein n=1 Tax=Pareuzebyella sediminis TaxID=2607998 RepID=UPI0011EE8127|nr:hypothetical protein [Pareuzebyella sediminis]
MMLKKTTPYRHGHGHKNLPYFYQHKTENHNISTFFNLVVSLANQKNYSRIMPTGDVVVKKTTTPFNPVTCKLTTPADVHGRLKTCTRMILYIQYHYKNRCFPSKHASFFAGGIYLFL